jgi:hypothetical protein
MIRSLRTRSRFLRAPALVACLALAAGCDQAGPRRDEAAVETPAAAESVAATEPELVRLTTPAPGDTVTSPLALRGEARGTWYFEASFPVRLLDADGREIAVTYATAPGEWMTTEFVPLTSTVTFAAPPAGSAGTLVLVKDNPSDQRELDDERRIPVVFAGR